MANIAFCRGFVPGLRGSVTPLRLPWVAIPRFQLKRVEMATLDAQFYGSLRNPGPIMEPDSGTGAEARPDSGFHVIFYTLDWDDGDETAVRENKIRFYNSAYRYLRSDSFTVRTAPTNSVRRECGS